MPFRTASTFFNYLDLVWDHFAAVKGLVDERRLERKQRAVYKSTKPDTHVEVFLNPGVRGLPVLGPNVAVHVEAGEVFGGGLAGFKVGLRGEVLLDALLGLMMPWRGVGRAGDMGYDTWYVVNILGTRYSNSTPETRPIEETYTRYSSVS